MGHCPFRAVDPHIRVSKQSFAKAVLLTPNMADPPLLMFQRKPEGFFYGDRQRQGRRAAAVKGRAGTSVYLRLNDQTLLFNEESAAVKPVEFVRRNTHGIYSIQHQCCLPHCLCGIHMEAAVGEPHSLAAAGQSAIRPLKRAPMK